jgi:molecular chaperone GrpE
VTEEQIRIEEEPIASSNPKDQGAADTGEEPAVEAAVSEVSDSEAPVTEVIEGEIVDEEMEAAAVAVDEEAAEAVEKEVEEVDELEALCQQLETAQAQADEYLDDLRRERAAFQNYKKRQENERAKLRQMAVSSLLVQILPVLDDLERALEAVPEDHGDQPWVEGIELIQRKLQTTLGSNGVVAVEVEPGQSFDPFVHEAVSYEENEDHKEGEIIDVVQKGYKLGERTLRPAMVRVAK